jgi:hypothetical protein
MCKCGDDDTTPFCGAPGCLWPDDVLDSNIAITEFLAGLRWMAQNGHMPFNDYLALCIEFDPNDPPDDEEPYEAPDEDAA